MTDHDSDESERQRVARMIRKEERRIQKNINKLSKYYINEYQCKFLQYIEKFDFMDKNGDKIGYGLYNIGHQRDTNLFTIHVRIEGFLGKKLYTKLLIFSRVDCHYRTLEESRQSWLGTGPNALIRNLSLFSYPDHYLCIVTTGTQDKPIKKRIKLNHYRDKLLINEGAIILLYRQMGLMNFKGELQTYTINSNGKQVPSILTCTVSKERLVNGYLMDTITIERHIKRNENSDVTNDAVLTVLTRNAGFCIHHEWIDRNVYLIVKRLWNPYTGHIKEGASKDKNFLDDLELRSKIQDLNVSLKVEHQKYLDDNPEILHLLGDFLQSALLYQPENVLNFAQDFFNTFSIPSNVAKDGEIEKKVEKKFSWGESIRLVRQPWCETYDCQIL